MGAGGLLAEIPTRPQPRDETATRRARSRRRAWPSGARAGRSTRMGGPNKLLAEPTASRWSCMP
jgi:molybdenum cofactor cytidylyltransferase